MSATPRPWRYDVCVKSVRSGVTFRIIDTGWKLIGHFTGSPEYAALIVRAVNERDGLLAQIMKLTGSEHYRQTTLARKQNDAMREALESALYTRREKATSRRANMWRG